MKRKYHEIWRKGQQFRGQQDFVKLTLVKEKLFYTDRESHRQMFFQQSTGSWCWVSGWKNKWMRKTNRSNELSDSPLKLGRRMKAPHQHQLRPFRFHSSGKEMFKNTGWRKNCAADWVLDTLWKMSRISERKQKGEKKKYICRAGSWNTRVRWGERPDSRQGTAVPGSRRWSRRAGA